MGRVAAPSILKQGLLLHRLPLLLDLLDGSARGAACTGLSGDCVVPILANISAARREPQRNQLFVRQAYYIHDIQQMLGTCLLDPLLPLGLAASDSLLIALASKHLLIGSGGNSLEAVRLPGS